MWSYFPAILILSQNYVIQGLIAAPSLESYNVDPASLTVSGISSGGAMSGQLHFIFSDEVKGGAVIAGIPYLCGTNLEEALACIGSPNQQDLPDSIARTNALNGTGKIDNLNNLKSSHVYIFHGRNDTRVLPESGRNLQLQYEHYGANVFAEMRFDAGHGWPVDGNGYGGPCEANSNVDFDYINECGYNTAFEMFQWLYGSSIVKPEASYVADGHLLEFDQTEFIMHPEIATVGDVGMVYVPKSCEDKKTTCRVHVALHGCSSNKEFLEDRFPRKTQYCEVAELNNIIIIFPQTKNTPDQTAGCWDWFGYTNAEFGTNSGIQPNVIRKMWRRVIEIEQSSWGNQFLPSCLLYASVLLAEVFILS